MKLDGPTLAATGSSAGADRRECAHQRVRPVVRVHPGDAPGHDLARRTHSEPLLVHHARRARISRSPRRSGTHRPVDDRGRHGRRDRAAQVRPAPTGAGGRLDHLVAVVCRDAPAGCPVGRERERRSAADRTCVVDRDRARRRGGDQVRRHDLLLVVFAASSTPWQQWPRSPCCRSSGPGGLPSSCSTRSRSCSPTAGSAASSSRSSFSPTGRDGRTPHRVRRHRVVRSRIVDSPRDPRIATGPRFHRWATFGLPYALGIPIAVSRSALLVTSSVIIVFWFGEGRDGFVCDRSAWSSPC